VHTVRSISMIVFTPVGRRADLLLWQVDSLGRMSINDLFSN
jgi:hypothetical protein